MDYNFIILSIFKTHYNILEGNEQNVLEFSSQIINFILLKKQLKFY